jgi:excisionase family DNA binding protein
MTVDEAVDVTGRPPSTIRRWCQNGRLDARKIGKKVWLIDIASIERLAPNKSRWAAAVGLMKAALPYLDVAAARPDAMRPSVIADGMRALFAADTIDGGSARVGPGEP